MSSKKVGDCRSVLNAGVFLMIFGWLTFITIHLIKDDERHEKGEAFSRERRQSGGQGSQSLGGAIYVRWGRTVCPVDAELVYKGFVGGGHHYNQEGGGSNYVCLSEDPKYASTKPGENGNGALIFGTEFEVSGYGLFNTVNSNPNALHNSDVLCAVCRSSTKTSYVMIPGTNECPTSDWNKEYWGYLMTSHYNHKAQHDFVCVDNAPEKGIEGGAKDENGALMHHVEGRCGSLPCQPYKSGAELTCVVCTK